MCICHCYATAWLPASPPVLHCHWETGRCIRPGSALIHMTSPEGGPCRWRGTSSRNKSLIKGHSCRSASSTTSQLREMTQRSQGEDAVVVVVYKQNYLQTYCTWAINKSKIACWDWMLFTNMTSICCSWVCVSTMGDCNRAVKLHGPTTA